MQRWDELADAYSETSEVDISWFRGTGRAFAEASRVMAGSGLRTFHQMGPTIVEIEGNRALAETGCAIHAIGTVGGAPADIVSYSRLFERVRRVNRRWLLETLQIVYIQDMILPLNPSQVPVIDPAALEGYRSSYRFLSFLLAQTGRQPRADLPGVDRPDLVEKLVASNRKWLHQA